MKNKSTIPKGYKQTKIGILPVEWEVKYFKDIINIRSGQVDPKEEPYASMFLVAPNHIESGSGAISKYETAKLQGAISGKYEVQAGDIIYSKIRPYLKKAAIAKVDCICSADMYAIDGIDATNEYLLSAMLGGHFTNYANSVSARTGMPKINRQDLLAYKIPLPPLPEQQKIAQILATWDKAIQTQTRLINAKKEQKRGLMQRLLTGGVRLPGFEKSQEKVKTKFGQFPADWPIVKIKDIASEVSIKNKEDIKYPVMSCTKHKGLVDSLKYFGKRIFSKDTSTYKMVKRNQFAYATNHIEEGSIGYQDIHDMGLISPMYTAFKTNNKVDDSFLYRVLKSPLFVHKYSSNTSASVDRRGSLRWKQFSLLKLSLPPLEEQTAIANILTTADQEITLLETRLTELREQKRGLMQRLLTGAVRVTVPATA